MNCVALVITRSRFMSALLRVTSDSIGTRTVWVDLVLRILVLLFGEYLRYKQTGHSEQKAASRQDKHHSIHQGDPDSAPAKCPG